MTTPILQVLGVTYRADGAAILDDVSWEIRRGEHWAVLGPNGAGKTTLLRVACGYLWPNDGGEVLRLGQRALDLRELRRSIGWVSHRLASDIPKHEPARDTVLSGAVGQTGLKIFPFAPRPEVEDYERADRHMDELGCSHLADRPFGVLSQGEQQRVLIARALMARPLVVFLDEPCAGLDPGGRERMLETIQQLAARSDGPALVLVTHHLEEIMPGFDRLLAMRRAKIVAQGPTATTVTPELLASLYDRPVRELVRRDGRTWAIF